MKVRDFIKINADIDVYDDVCEELAICFCGPIALTEEGEKHFAKVLNYDIDLDFSGDIKTAVCHVDDEIDKVWKRKLRKAEEFFEALAGYCAVDDYNKWFKEQDFGQYAINPDANMCVSVYCDTTPWYTEEEISENNVCDMVFPHKMVQEFYNTIPDMPWSFEEWISDEYTCDDTIGLFEFCKQRGFIAVRED